MKLSMSGNQPKITKQAKKEDITHKEKTSSTETDPEMTQF